jgi:hypothetical protein
LRGVRYRSALLRREGSMKSFVIACAALACAVATPSTAASLKDVDPQVLKDAQCMVAVLKKEPGIDEAKLGVKTSDGWVHPYVEYRTFADKNGDQQVIRFEALRGALGESKKDYYFETVLFGLIAAGQGAPNDWGASALIDKWKAECGVDATILFE